MFFDTETDEIAKTAMRQEQVFFLASSIYYEQSTTGKKPINIEKPHMTINSLWDEITSHTYQKTRLLLIAHNLQYDMIASDGFNQLKARGFKPQKIIMNDTTNIWDFACENQTITLLDNLNYFVMPLATLGKHLNYPKLTMPEITDPLEIWQNYCMQDSRIMLKAWLTWFEFLQTHDLGYWGKTLPAQALNAYRHRFMPTKIHIHDNPSILKLERLSYYGGRSEAWKIGDFRGEPVKILDINSMYPSIMASNEFPTRLVDHGAGIDPPKLNRLMKKYCITAEVDLETPSPIFPYRLKNTLIFPVGRFTAYLSTPELAHALKIGAVRKVKKYAVYEKAYLFKDYVEELYRLRMKYKELHNLPWELVCKLLLNALYGKFGQRIYPWEYVRDCPETHDHSWFETNISDHITKSYRVLCGVMEVQGEPIESYNSFPAIAAHVTAYARIKLWHLIEKIKKENLYYIDTDSLFVTPTGYRNLEEELSETKLGALKLEDSVNQLIIHGVKDYQTEHVHKIKGVRKNATKLSEHVYSQWQFEGLKSKLKQGQTNQITWILNTKHLKRDYKKGIKTPEGIVNPFELDCWSDLSED